MSDVPPQAMPGQAPDDAPSEEEVREYMAQMRQAPAEQVIAEVLQGLLNAGQIKLGRRDARLLLDTAAQVADQTRSHLSSELAGQIDSALDQLRLAQVEAEQQVAQSGQAEANDITAPSGGAASGADTGGGQATTSGGQPTSPQSGAGGGASDRLWIPGR